MRVDGSAPVSAARRVVRRLLVASAIVSSKESKRKRLIFIEGLPGKFMVFMFYFTLFE